MIYLALLARERFGLGPRRRRIHLACAEDRICCTIDVPAMLSAQPNINPMLKKSLWLVGILLLLSLGAVFMVNGRDKDTKVSATRNAELRVWVEPAEAIIKVGKPVTVEVVAEYVDPILVFPSLGAQLAPSSSLVLSSSNLNLEEEFAGRVTLGEVKITALEPGTHTVEIVPESVKTSFPDVKVITAKATFIAR